MLITIFQTYAFLILIIWCNERTPQVYSFRMAVFVALFNRTHTIALPLWWEMSLCCLCIGIVYVSYQTKVKWVEFPQIDTHTHTHIAIQVKCNNNLSKHLRCVAFWKILHLKMAIEVVDSLRAASELHNIKIQNECAQRVKSFAIKLYVSLEIYVIVCYHIQVVHMHGCQSALTMWFFKCVTFLVLLLFCFYFCRERSNNAMYGGIHIMRRQERDNNYD